MKKVLLLTLIVLIIPFLFVQFFRKNNLSFVYNSNTIVRVKNEKSGKISNIPLEEYIVGVLAGEMPITFELEALKAQAVAARSYVMKQMQYNKNLDYDVVDTVVNQVYLSDEYLKTVWKDEYLSKISKLKKAVSETFNEYLDYNGTIAEAMFFSTSSGYTENSEEVFSTALPYLRSVSSVWDEISPLYEVKYNFSFFDFYKKLGIDYNEQLNIEILSTTSTGRVKELEINNIKLNANKFVSLLKLKSNYFKISVKNNNIEIITKGYGHGVGMSQYGAQAMALAGKKYDEILNYYYQGTKIKKI